MTPEDYLRQYTEPFCSMETESVALKPGMGLARGYFYPPYLPSETYLDTLSRSDLLEIAQQLLATEYPAQRLIRRQVREYLETMQRLRNEREWRQAEMERLNGELAGRVEELANLEVERRRLESLLSNLYVELGNCQDQLVTLKQEHGRLHETMEKLWASNSWKVTAPLRWLGRTIRRQ